MQPSFESLNSQYANVSSLVDFLGVPNAWSWNYLEIFVYIVLGRCCQVAIWAISTRPDDTHFYALLWALLRRPWVGLFFGPMSWYYFVSYFAMFPEWYYFSTLVALHFHPQLGCIMQDIPVLTHDCMIAVISQDVLYGWSALWLTYLIYMPTVFLCSYFVYRLLQRERPEVFGQLTFNRFLFHTHGFDFTFGIEQ